MSKKRKMVQISRIRGTYYLTMVGIQITELRSLILRRRLQILVHSCIYYELNSSIVPDSTWSSWAMELVELQRKYPTISKSVDYSREFSGFDGSTGFHLPLRNPEIMEKANYLLRLHQSKISKGGKT